jgi:hypothetical protein
MAPPKRRMMFQGTPSRSLRIRTLKTNSRTQAVRMMALLLIGASKGIYALTLRIAMAEKTITSVSFSVPFIGPNRV